MVSKDFDTVYIKDLLYSLFKNIISNDIYGYGINIFINGVWIGFILDQDITKDTFIQKFKYFRNIKKIIPYDVSISFDRIDNEININSDSGRILRPVLNIQNIQHLNEIVNNTPINTLWTTLVENNYIINIDGGEAESSLISMNPNDINKYDYEYCEIHPCLMLGICGNIIPFSEHSQSPRNVYASAMCKQAIGIYSISYNQRFDTTSHILNYPQKRLAPTLISQICHYEDNPSGINAIVAIMCYGGFNQEDSVIINQSAIDRGLFMSTSYKSLSTEENKKGTHESEDIRIPEKNLRNTNYNYSKLNDDGIIPLGTFVEKNDVVVGKVYNNNDKPISDCSLACKASETGFVDKIYITKNSGGYKHIKIKIRRFRIPEIGDKMACYTPDHDVLTYNRGWVNITKICKDDIIYTLEPIKKNIEYHKPIEIFKYQYSGEIINISGKNINLNITLNHKCFVCPTKSYNNESFNKLSYELIEIKDLLGKGKVFLKAANNNTSIKFKLTDEYIKYYIKYFKNHNTFPKSVWQLTQQQSFILFNIIVNNLFINLNMADDIQRLALHSGISVDIIDQYIKINRHNYENQPSANKKQIHEQKHEYTGKVYCIEVPNHILYVRRNGKPIWCGNSIHAQKGTIGMTYRQEDMPFTSNGITPDIILNPHALPSRMTINMLMEILCCKTSCFTGLMQDSTPFCYDGEQLIKEVSEKLAKNGYQRMGFETLYNGFTGKALKAKIFMGPVYYQRLKHLVADKHHSRSWGNVQLLSRQPCAGRSRDGGLRFGEMEKDCMIAHGASSFLKERLFDMSDKYQIVVCSECGVIVNNSSKCMNCEGDECKILNIPYAFKLLVQELQAMCIKIRFE